MGWQTRERFSHGEKQLAKRRIAAIQKVIPEKVSVLKCKVYAIHRKHVASIPQAYQSALEVYYRVLAGLVPGLWGKGVCV